MAIDFKRIADRLLRDAPGYLGEWLPAGKLKGREYVAGSLNGESGHSLSINIDTGVWKDFATGEGGADLISLYAAIHKLTQGQAAKFFSDGKNDELPSETYILGIESPPIPDHSKYGKAEAVYEYRRADGKVVGYICRFPPPNPNEHKQFIPRSSWRRHDGTITWKWKKWQCATPLYRLAELLKDTELPVLVVEGEKAAIAAQKLLSDWIVVSWCGGAKAIKETDWEPLRQRADVWMWPDNDQAGEDAAYAIKKLVQNIRIVKLPDGLPAKWDLADAEAGFDPRPFLTESNEDQVKVSKPLVNLERGQLIFTDLDPDSPKRALSTITNLMDLLQYYKITCRYNVITKRIDFNIPGETWSVENADDCCSAVIYSYMKSWKVGTDNYLNYLLRIADMNIYNPILDWVRSHPWDRITRLPEFYDTIESPEISAKEMLIRRWLITAMSMILGEGIDSAGCLVLQGAQGMGKTWWIRKLMPPDVSQKYIRTDATVDPKDRDSVSQIIGYWIVELGEIGATFRKADLDALKTFITRQNDIIRRPYGAGDKQYPRRTALIASVDQEYYLHDTAGNRRFWTIPCTAINSYHDIDMQQLWAEVLYLIEERGESWKLEEAEKLHIARINEGKQQIEPIFEMIEAKFKMGSDEFHTQWHTATQIAEHIGIKNITQRETRLIANFLRKRNVQSRRSEQSILFRIEKRNNFY